MQTVKDYAAAHGVTPRWVRHWCATGQLEAEKIGRDWLIADGQAPPEREDPRGRKRGGAVWCLGQEVSPKGYDHPVGRIVEVLPEVIEGRGIRIRVHWGLKTTICEARNYRAI